MRALSDNVRDFISELRKLTTGDLRTDDVSRTLYSTDASIYQVMPHGVLIPENLEDVHAAVELAGRYGVKLLPRTAGSSLAGQAVNEALVIDFTRHLDQVLEVNEEEHWVRVQPGIVLDQLNLDLAPYGLKFGPDPASSNRAALGGIVANNSTGSHSILYGMTADHVLDMDVFLADGSTTRFGPMSADQLEQKQRLSGFEGNIYRELAAMTSNPEHRATIESGTPVHWRRCGGYNLDRLIGPGPTFRVPQTGVFNLAKLVCGSEGTLAVMSEIKLNLVPLPEHAALCVVHFDSLEKALRAVPVMLEVDPSAVELLDNYGLRLCRDVPEYARLLTSFIDGRPDCVLVTEFYGGSASELQHKVARLKTHIASQGVPFTATVDVFEPARQADVWKVRKVALGLLMSIKGDHKPIPFIEDAAVPVEHLADYVTRIEDFAANLGTRIAYYAHASAGCVHIRPLINAKDAADVAKLPEITAFSVELLRAFGGSLSSEHGDGKARSWFNEAFFGPDLYGLYRDTKRIFDPKNILNPGNIVDAAPMTKDLRFGPEYQAVPLELNLDWSSDLGFDRAVEMCNGAGICRKRTADTMCPSFQATREEKHSTRGRANLLRAAMSGTLPREELFGDKMYEAMDLCIGCKACKAECPSSVDMAKIRFEFLSQYYQEHGTPKRAQRFGDVAEASRRVAGPMAGFVNRSLETRPVRWMLERTMGISRERILPSFATRSYDQWFADRRAAGGPSARSSGPGSAAGPLGAPSGDGAGEPVVLFIDTFSNYNEPHVAIAATEVLERCGYHVIPSNHGCCGRPMISKGLVNEARAAAAETIRRLDHFASQGIPIIGLEPSCLLSVRDEYGYLLEDQRAVGRVAEHSVLFEEFFAKGRLDRLSRLASRAGAAAGDATASDVASGISRTETPGGLPAADKGHQPRRRPGALRALLHGHCHQKALVGTGPSRAILEAVGIEVTEVDSGCCGMAGSFGYEAEHYEVSIAMAERRLYPAVRAVDDRTLVVAAGTSCRHQIEHGTERDALHPAEVLAGAIL